MALAVGQCGPREIRVAGAERDIVRVWTDAMWEPPAPAGMGIVVSPGEGQRPVVGWAVVPDCVLQGLLPRKQHINQVEALACCLVPFNFPDLLKGKDVLWFIDNTSALKGVIGGHSSIADSARICSAFHLLMQKLDARVWGGTCG